MARTIDEVVALHIGGLAIELCKQIQVNEELKLELMKLNQKPAKKEPKKEGVE